MVRDAADKERVMITQLVGNEKLMKTERRGGAEFGKRYACLL